MIRKVRLVVVIIIKIKFHANSIILKIYSKIEVCISKGFVCDY